MFCFGGNFPQQVFECKITQIKLETFSLCAGMGHASVWHTIVSLNFHGILMHRERKKGRHGGLAGGHQSSLQFFPLFSWIFKFAYSKVSKQNQQTQIRSLILSQVFCPVATVLLSSKIRCFTCQVTTPHCLVHCNTGNKTLWNAECVTKGKKNVMRGKETPSQRPQLFIASHPSVFLR